MTPHQYLFYAIQKKLHLDTVWYRYCFTVVRETDASKAKLYPGKLVQEPFGFFYIDDENKPVKIQTNQKTSEPLFGKNDPVTITKDWIPSLQETSLETTIGRLLVNLFIVEAFGSKVAYMNDKFGPSDVEGKIAPLVKSTPPEGSERDPKVFYVDEYVKFCEGVSFLENLSAIFSHSVSRVGVLPAPGRREFKQELLKKYEGKLTDPVEMSKFEEELGQYDNNYLKQDPAYGTFMKGKTAKSRSKLFMSQGGEANNFTGSMEVTPIIPALEDGIALDDKGFTASSNMIRFGSFARGAETVNGGVVAKGLNNAADNWVVVDGDCGSKLGITRVYIGSETYRLIGRTAIIDGKLVEIPDQETASKFDGKSVILRSPLYCKMESTRTCSKCAGPELSIFKKGVTIPLGEVSSGILSDSLKMMHDSSLTTTVMDLKSVLS